MSDEIREPEAEAQAAEEPPPEEPPAGEEPLPEEASSLTGELAALEDALEAEPAAEAEPDLIAEPEPGPEPAPEAEPGGQPSLEPDLPAEGALGAELADPTDASDIADATAPDETAILDETPAVAETAVLAAVAAEGASVEGAPVVTTPPAETPLPGEVDLGPERRSNTWVWVGLIVGVLIAAGAVGYVWWYSTSRPIVVPGVVGKLPAQATQTLNDVGLRLGKVSEVPTDTAPAGTVIEQSPAAATELKPEGTVSIVLAASPTVSKVPDTVGQTADAAASALADLQLAVDEVEVYHASTVAGTVASQIPSAGAELAPGTAVALIVSKGPVPTQNRVPLLTGLPEIDAETLVEARNLRILTYRSYDASIAAGTVLRQSPTAGSFATYDGFVQYLISAGPGSATVTMPNVVNVTRGAAEDRLDALGLKVSVKKAAHASIAKNHVISQMPPSGTKVAKNATVGLIVSRGPETEAKVPDLEGLTEAEANDAVADAGLVPVAVQIDTDAYPAGVVYGQYPEAGSPLLFRLSVVFAVAR